MKFMKKQRIKKALTKVTSLTLSLALLLTPGCTFALDTVDESGEAFREFIQDGVTYYDIYNGKTKDRPENTDVDQMIQQVLYEKKDGQGHSAAEYWAALAASVYASNPSSWRENGEEGNHGANKDAGDYAERLMKDPEKGKGYYGNVQKWLASKSGGEDDTDDHKKYRKQDINLKASGMMTAQSLAEVEDTAFRYLVDVNPGKIKTSHFDKYNSLKGMNEESSAGDVVYHLVAMRDRVGGTFEYEYNCFGIAYYDFQAIPFTGKEGEGITTALKGYDNLDEAKGETISGFEYNSSSDTHIDRTRNESKEDISKTISSEWSNDEEFSSEITTLKGMTFGQEESAEFTFGKDDAFFHAAAGFTFTEEELFQEGLNTTNSTAQHDGGGSETSVPIQSHMALEQMTLTTKTDSQTRYDCPVKITYKVAIFSYNGGYYDDNAATTYFNTAGYEQRSFMTVFGNHTDGAVESLRNCMAKDAGYDSSYRLTRGIREKHASNDDAYWDTPWADHLDYSRMKSAAGSAGISPSYDEASGFLSKNQPISITGGVLSRQATATESIVGDAIQIYPLVSVTLDKAQRDVIALKENKELHLKNIEVEAWDSQGVDFHKFIYTDGYWTLVNKNGEPIESTKAIKLYQNKNGDYVVKAVEPGRAYVKYMIPEGAYKYLNAADTVVTIEPDEVETPTITVNVKENTAVPTKIAVEGEVDIYYDDPGDSGKGAVIDLNKVNGLEAVVYDQKGKVMDVEAQWEPASDTMGIEIKDNKMTVHEDGDYELKAVYEEIKSEETGIHVEKRGSDEEQTAGVSEEQASGSEQEGGSGEDYAQAEDAVNTFLECSSEQTSLAEACLFVKNRMGQESTVNEMIFTEALLQLAGKQGSSVEQKEYELAALIWAIENGLVSSSQGYTLTIGGGITSLQMAMLGYNANVKFGRDVSCEDVIHNYAGSENLTEEQRTAMNWAISKGCLTEEEEASKTLDVDRIVTDAELAAYNVETVENPEVSDEQVEEAIEDARETNE